MYVCRYDTYNMDFNYIFNGNEFLQEFCLGII